mgnify:CR=1 FL=1
MTIESWVLPIRDITSFYTWETIGNWWKMYYVLDTKELITKFWDDVHAIFGRKTAPTLIRRAIVWERITTYVENKNWEKILESVFIAKAWQYVFQNINNLEDTYIPQKQWVIDGYIPQNWDYNVWDEFREFFKKSKPSKLLIGLIKKPTVITVKSWWNINQFLDEWAVLKLEESPLLEVTWINKWGFELWEITDKDWNIL